MTILDVQCEIFYEILKAGFMCVSFHHTNTVKRQSHIPLQYYTYIEIAQSLFVTFPLLHTLLPICSGVGILQRLNTMPNNTGLEADSGHQLGLVSCHSASRQPHIGRWISPSGEDITFSNDSIFTVEFHDGDFPSYIALSVSPGTSE